eukprot:SAG11_NODE_2766_length_2998_cov_1.572611_1_plen_536_part_00
MKDVARARWSEPAAKRSRSSDATPRARFATVQLPVGIAGKVEKWENARSALQPPNRLDTLGFWKVTWDEKYNSWYWWNTRTRQTSWDDRLIGRGAPIVTVQRDSLALRVIRHDAEEHCDLYCATDWLNHIVSLTEGPVHSAHTAVQAARLVALRRWLLGEFKAELITREGGGPNTTLEFLRSGHMVMLVRESPDVAVLVRERATEALLRDMARDRKSEFSAPEPSAATPAAASGRGSAARAASAASSNAGQVAWELLCRHFAAREVCAKPRSPCWYRQAMTARLDSSEIVSLVRTRTTSVALVVQIAGSKLSAQQLQERYKGFDPASVLDLEPSMIDGLADMFRRKRPYLVTLARQLVWNEVRTADYNEARKLGLLQQPREDALSASGYAAAAAAGRAHAGLCKDGEEQGVGAEGASGSTGAGKDGSRGTKAPKLKCVEQINRLELERIHLAQQCEPEPPKLTTDELLRIASACCLTLEETRSWFQNKNRGTVPGRARGKPKGTKDNRIALPPRLEEWRGMEMWKEKDKTTSKER